MTPLVQLAVVAGGHVIVHAAHRPTAGALHDAPASIFSFFALAFFFFSEASAGFTISTPVNNATTRLLTVRPFSGAYRLAGPMARFPRKSITCWRAPAAASASYPSLTRKCTRSGKCMSKVCGAYG
jgi:hypothetical protein